MAVGNVGHQLERNAVDQMNTYLSRDGGLTWTEVMKGSHIYEIGDHGGLIVAAPNTEKTTEISYTFNEGETWHKLTISDTPIDVTNIIIEPESISQQFVVYVQYNKEAILHKQVQLGPNPLVSEAPPVRGGQGPRKLPELRLLAQT